MGIYDLRSYLETLEQNQRLLRIRKDVDLDYELANLAATVARRLGNAIFFEKIKRDSPPSQQGQLYPWGVFTNALVNPSLAALALECSVEDLSARMGRALDPAQGIAPRVTEQAPPWQANVLTGEQINLYDLPIPIHGQYDGGAFITGGVTVSRDPVSGRGNLSYNRMQVLDRRTFGFNVNEWRHVMQFYKHQQAQNQPLPIAVAIGLDPAIMIAAAARYEGDELAIAGALRGEGVLVTKGVTVDLLIPYHAEIVIEGYLPPHKRHPEGPLAEFHGYYGEIWDSPVFEVTAVCFRNRPIYQTIVPGWDEHIYIGNVLPREPLLLRFVRHVSPNVRALHIPPYGNGFLAVIQLEKSNPGEPKNVALAAFTAHVNIAKVIVVDPDVNIYDPADLHWALTNRVDWGRDVVRIQGAQGHEMDPTANELGVHTKVIIDATYKPEIRAYGQRVAYPVVDLNLYL
ncbi:MAG: UbiD family decarboxylase [Anaerolineales bacterium]|nr:UbiD family decarboxylase [Anaerolineales bacterium]MDW8447167.1 UbiD family decarboxylase [Anaerolineales bacterium]